MKEKSTVIGLSPDRSAWLGVMQEVPGLTRPDGNILVFLLPYGPWRRARPGYQAYLGMCSASIHKGVCCGPFSPHQPNLLQEFGGLNPPPNTRMDGRWGSWLCEPILLKLYIVQILFPFCWGNNPLLGGRIYHPIIVGHLIL